MSFSKPWRRFITEAGKIIFRPVLGLVLKQREGYNLYSFLIDSGADISLGPRELCDKMGLKWEKGKKITLTGISKKPGCGVKGRILEVEGVVPEVMVEVRFPLCFAEGDAPYLLGREGFFDVFGIKLDKRKRITRFSLTRSAI